MSHSTHSARLHALTAALCALLLLVALCLMDANRAPWWALLGTQGALLVATASAGMWLDRAFGDWRSAFGPGGSRGNHGYSDGPNAKRQTPNADGGGPLQVTGRARYHLPGLDGRALRRGEGGPPSTEQVFWIERGRKEDEN